MTSTPAPAVLPTTDFDLDGNPGLTIANSDGHGNQKSANFQLWTFTAPAPLVLSGPVVLNLWSSSGVFGATGKGTIFVYLENCGPGGATNAYFAGCTTIASNTVFEDPWNTSTTGWGNRLITIGNVSATIPLGNELRVRVLFREKAGLWIMMSSDYPTGLIATLGS
jgi:hypothetical protein